AWAKGWQVKLDDAHGQPLQRTKIRALLASTPLETNQAAVFRGNEDRRPARAVEVGQDRLAGAAAEPDRPGPTGLAVAIAEDAALAIPSAGHAGQPARAERHRGPPAGAGLGPAAGPAVPDPKPQRPVVQADRQPPPGRVERQRPDLRRRVAGGDPPSVVR